jgi:hypothetical protein
MIEYVLEYYNEENDMWISTVSYKNFEFMKYMVSILRESYPNDCYRVVLVTREIIEE